VSRKCLKKTKLPRTQNLDGRRGDQSSLPQRQKEKRLPGTYLMRQGKRGDKSLHWKRKFLIRGQGEGKNPFAHLRYLKSPNAARDNPLSKKKTRREKNKNIEKVCPERIRQRVRSGGTFPFTMGEGVHKLRDVENCVDCGKGRKNTQRADPPRAPKANQIKYSTGKKKNYEKGKFCLSRTVLSRKMGVGITERGRRLELRRTSCRQTNRPKRRGGGESICRSERGAKLNQNQTLLAPPRQQGHEWQYEKGFAARGFPPKK